MSPTRRSSDTDDIVIAVMGATGAGKSTFVNLASNSKLVVGRGLQSCTSAVEPSETFQMSGRNVILLDTPGFDDTTRSDSDTLRLISNYLASTYERDIRLSGIIFLHRISDVRMTGMSRRNFSMFRRLCGDHALENVIIATTMWSEVSEERGEERERELETSEILFEPVLSLGAQMRRHNNTYSSAERILGEIIAKHPVALKIQTQIVDEHKELEETDAGGELMQEMVKMTRKHREELAAVRQEMQNALLAKDQETQRELQQVHQQLTARIYRLEEDRENMSARFAEEKHRSDERLNKALAALHKAQAANRNVEGDQSQSKSASKVKSGVATVLKVLAMGAGLLVAPHLAVTAAFT